MPCIELVFSFGRYITFISAHIRTKIPGILIFTCPKGLVETFASWKVDSNRRKLKQLSLSLPDKAL